MSHSEMWTGMPDLSLSFPCSLVCEFVRVFCGCSVKVMMALCSESEDCFGTYGMYFSLRIVEFSKTIRRLFPAKSDPWRPKQEGIVVLGPVVDSSASPSPPPPSPEQRRQHGGRPVNERGRRQAGQRRRRVAYPLRDGVEGRGRLRRGGQPVLGLVGQFLCGSAGARFSEFVAVFLIKERIEKWAF